MVDYILYSIISTISGQVYMYFHDATFCGFNNLKNVTNIYNIILDVFPNNGKESNQILYKVHVKVDSNQYCNHTNLSN